MDGFKEIILQSSILDNYSNLAIRFQVGRI